MALSRLKAKLRRRARPTDGTLFSDHSAPTAIGASVLPPPTVSPDAASDPAVQATDKRDLWLEAFGKLSQKSQLELEKRGMKTSEPFADQVDAFQKEAERLRDQSLARDWKIPIGDREFPVRQTTAQVALWARKIGDIAIQFAPSPGAGVWAVAKTILQVRYPSSLRIWKPALNTSNPGDREF